ncbi:hypothetical protein F511_20006 [Dorcoceras hygrometricum]|uniref:Uncharacterized protein n=1 Tax=Dorcoceras hygrometricum TaxID=472368 RepID=A0A2Z7DCX6_9LAMI|nr:hypothetical protein F511_20006 [Dorcoceras hygrometricum]
MPPVSHRDPMTEQHAPDPEDSCSDRKVARGLVLRTENVSRGLVTSRILSRYVFPYLSDIIIEDHREDLAPKIAESISPGYAHLHRLAPL